MAGRIRTFLSDNIVLVVGFPLLGGVHWCWLQLQKIDTLVPPEQRNLEQPFIRGLKVVKKEAMSHWYGTEADPDSGGDKKQTDKNKH